MKKMISVITVLFIVVYLSMCVGSAHNNVPTQLQLLQDDFTSECSSAKWKTNVGFLEGDDFGFCLGKIVEERDNFLKDLGIKSFNAEWICSCKDITSGTTRIVHPYAHFAGLYWR